MADSGGVVSNPWSFLTILAVVGGVAGITIFAIQHYSTATDAGTVLGVVIPVFATLGAAVFGVTAAYKAGSSTGGKQATQNAGKTLQPQVDNLSNALEPLLQTIEREGSTAAGKSLITVGANPVDFDQKDIAAIRNELATVGGTVKGLTT